jgi:nucleic acid/nucleotide deaminase of polymorphic system toxin
MEHVEGHAAATMRELKIQEGTLYINHRNGPCPNCDSLLNRMLPSGARLEVVWPRGAKTYEGIQP